MGSIIIPVNQITYVNPVLEFEDSGWVIAEGFATHYPCNAGFMTYTGDLTQMGLLPGVQYDITYTLDQWISGEVHPLFGASAGVNRTANGTYTDTLTWDGSSPLQFYSDGFLRISELIISEHLLNTANGMTIAFCEKFKKFSTAYSFKQEAYTRYGDKLFAFKDGQLYHHNSNDLYNNFNGVQYQSEITFYINIDSQLVKNYFSIRQIASQVWGSPTLGDIFILPYEGKPDGQSSRLKNGNYKQLQGDYFADFLRDMADPRFTDAQKALFKGAELQGKIMEITITNSGDTLVRMVSVDVMVSPQNYTYEAQ